MSLQEFIEQVGGGGELLTHRLRWIRSLHQGLREVGLGSPGAGQIGPVLGFEVAVGDGLRDARGLSNVTQRHCGEAAFKEQLLSGVQQVRVAFCPRSARCRAGRWAFLHESIS
ncbi:Uncharacterised protein [Mycobacteroides abscessus subsp. abscessus]|nr:Uncharacterised protein [Mycobacteroides abscessus subsp. abscessus]